MARNTGINRSVRMQALMLLALIAGSTVAQAAPAAAEESNTIGSVEVALAHQGSLWPDPVIGVCWETSASIGYPIGDSSAFATEKQWTRDAAQATWAAVSNVDFVGWGDCSPASEGLRIRVDEDRPHAKALGHQLDGVPGGMVLNFTFEDFAETCKRASDREFCVKAIAVHEFGHALGFTHEHLRDDRSRCNDEWNGTEPSVYLTPYDADSVMNYCAGWRASLSTYDVAGVRAAYGPFDNVVPMALRVTGDINIVDGEVFGSNESSSTHIDELVVLSNAQPVAELHFEPCAGDEVRVEVDIIVRQYQGTGNSAMSATATMYEGSSCGTDEREDSDKAIVEMDVLDHAYAVRMRLKNDDIVDDHATVILEVERDIHTVIDTATALGCSSCAADAEATRAWVDSWEGEAEFGVNPVVMLPDITDLVMPLLPLPEPTPGDGGDGDGDTVVAPEEPPVEEVPSEEEDPSSPDVGPDTDDTPAEEPSAEPVAPPQDPVAEPTLPQAQGGSAPSGTPDADIGEQGLDVEEGNSVDQAVEASPPASDEPTQALPAAREPARESAADGPVPLVVALLAVSVASVSAGWLLSRRT